jgi:hypothetical protein
MTKRFDNWVKRLKSPKLTKSEKVEGRDALMSFMNDTSSEEISEKKRGFATLFGSLVSMRPQAVMSMVLAVVIASGGTVSYAAESSLPGDFLYPVKTEVNEEVRSILTFDSKEKADWEVARVERRLNEVTALESEGALTEEIQVVIDQELDESMGQLSIWVDDWEDDDIWEDDYSYDDFLEELEDEVLSLFEDYEDEEWIDFDDYEEDLWIDFDEFVEDLETDEDLSEEELEEVIEDYLEDFEDELEDIDYEEDYEYYEDEDDYEYEYDEEEWDDEEDYDEDEEWDSEEDYDEYEEWEEDRDEDWEDYEGEDEEYDDYDEYEEWDDDDYDEYDYDEEDYDEDVVEDWEA